jgi:hypothetical protein
VRSVNLPALLRFQLSHGGDVLHYITVAPSDRVRLQESLERDTNDDPHATERLLTEMKARFADDFDVKQWLDDKGIPFP